MLPVLTPPQCRAWDQAAEAAGRPLRMLMETAGRAVANACLQEFGTAAAQGTLLACGPGNNGGDGWVAARSLHLMGIPTWVTEITSPSNSIAAEARRAALEDGVRTVAPDGPWPGLGLLVDGLLGTGAVGAPREPMLRLLARLREMALPIVAIDGPTGLDLATGVDHGATPAALTVSFGGVRRGHLLARDTIGNLLIAEIGLPASDPSWPQLVSSRWAAARLSPWESNLHKGRRGRVVIIGGAPGMSGAVRMSARAAFAAGAGLVHVVAPEGSMAELRSAEPDVQTLTHSFDLPFDEPLESLIASADSVVIGPGLGRAPERAEFVLAVLQLSKRVVIDADALMALRNRVPDLAQLASERELVLTPHLGEYRALFPESGDSLETDPWTAANTAAMVSGCTVLLKGVPTIVASSSGSMLTVASGNPGLATGGSGDVLSGIIGALMTQGTAFSEATAVAAQAMGEAADSAAAESTARMLRPMDVVASLASVWRSWEALRAPAASGWLLRLDQPINT